MLVSIDYGAYASFKGTRNEPADYLFWPFPEERQSDAPADLVPIDDRRSIRRIVVDKEVLDRFLPRDA